MKYVEPVYEETIVRKIIKAGKYVTEDGTEFNTEISAKFYESFCDLRKTWNVRELSQETMWFFENLWNLDMMANAERGFCYLVEIPKDVQTSTFCVEFNALFTYFRNNVKYGQGKYILYYAEGDNGVRDCLLIGLPEFKAKLEESIEFLKKDVILKNE